MSKREVALVACLGGFPPFSSFPSRFSGFPAGQSIVWHKTRENQGVIPSVRGWVWVS